MSDNDILLLILPTTAITVMILLGTGFACFVHRRRVSGKMDLGMMYITY